MIVRILGEGQLTVDDTLSAELNKLDATLQAALNAGDEKAFRAALEGLLSRVRAAGTPIPADSLEASDVILPYSEASMDDVHALLTDDGLIPG
jgi:PspA-Associated protein